MAKKTTITVKVAVGSLHEAEQTYAKGETFETTPERAAALGRLVEVVPPAKEDRKD